MQSTHDDICCSVTPPVPGQVIRLAVRDGRGMRIARIREGHNDGIGRFTLRGSAELSPPRHWDGFRLTSHGAKARRNVTAPRIGRREHFPVEKLGPANNRAPSNERRRTPPHPDLRLSIAIARLPVFYPERIAHLFVLLLVPASHCDNFPHTTAQWHP